MPDVLLDGRVLLFGAHPDPQGIPVRTLAPDQIVDIFSFFCARAIIIFCQSRGVETMARTIVPQFKRAKL